MFLSEFDNFNSGSLKLSWTRFDVSTSSTSSTSLIASVGETSEPRRRAHLDKLGVRVNQARRTKLGVRGSLGVN